MEHDATVDVTTALLDIHRRIRQGDPATADSARSLVQSIFFDARRYDMAMTAFCIGLFVYLLQLPFQLWPAF